MRPSSFDLAQPTSLQDGAAYARNGAVLLRGGQPLIHSPRLRTAQPASIVDLKQVAELSRDIQATGGAIRIGALATVASLLASAVVAERLPMLHEAAGRLGDVQVRNRATVVGNICWADPRANLAVALCAYGAVLKVSDGQAERSLDVLDVFAGFRTVTLTPGEVVTAIDVPVVDPAEPAAYREFSRQRNDLALVNMAVVRKQQARYVVVAGGLAQVPLRLDAVERLLAGGAAVSAESLKAAIEKSPLSSLGDPFGSLDYKVHVGSVILSRILDTLNNDAANDEGTSHAGR